MADVKISQLSTKTDLATTNYLPISDNTTTTKIGTDSLFGFRNRIINGNMRIDQRNVGTLNADLASNPFVVDRWLVGSNPANTFNGQQVSDAPAGFNKSIKINVVNTRTVAPTNNMCLVQRIEGNNIIDFAWGTSSAKPITISFWVKSSVTGTYSARIASIITSTYSYVYTYTVNVANTWEYKVINIPGPTVGTWADDIRTGIDFLYNLGSGSQYLTSTANQWLSNDYHGLNGTINFSSQTAGSTIQFTGIQLEPGSSATPFEFRPIGTELQLCQRYFQKSYQQDVKPGSSTASRNAVSHVYGPGGYQNIWWRLPVTMRTIPTPTAYNPNTGTVGEIYNSSNGVNYTIVFNNQYPYTSDSLVVGRVAINQTVQNELNVHFTADAELNPPQ